MILFREEHVFAILTGAKTQTRRIWAKPRARVGSLHLAKTKMLSTDYFARLHILAVYPEELGQISEDDAIAEGYRDRESYLAAFFRINRIQERDRAAWLLRPVYVVKFEVSYVDVEAA